MIDPRMNSFRLLEEEDGQRLFKPERSDRIRANVQERLDTMRLLGNILEMYVPAMADTVTNLSGGVGNAMSTEDLPEGFEFPETKSQNDPPNLPPRGPVMEDDDDTHYLR